MNLKKRIFQHNKIYYLCALMGVFVNTALTVWIAFLLKDFTDIAASGNMENLKHMLFQFLVFLILFVLFDAFGFYFKNRFIERGLRQYKEYAFDQIMAKHIASFQKESTSTYISALNNDVNSIEQHYLEGSFLIYTQFLMFVGGLCAMAYLNIKMTIAVIVVCLLPLIVSIAFGNNINEAEKNTSLHNGRFTGLIKGLLDGFTVIKSFQAEKEIAGNFAYENGLVEKVKRKRRDLISLVTLCSATGGLLVHIAVFGFGAFLAVHGEVTVGILVAFVQLTNYVVSPLQTAPALISAKKASATLMEKLEQLCQRSEEKRELTTLNCFKETIEFDHVSFGYEDSLVLQDVSFTLEKGKSYAIVGASGSGKSTLLQLLLGYHDYDGDIQMDGISLKHMISDGLYEMFGMIQQNVFIFDDSLEHNITMYKSFSKEDMEEAIHRAGLSKLWMEKGREYPCGENGCHLSGGEKQRISIARTLLKHTPILLMDEATAALDQATATAVEQAILNMEGLTRIIVTHKLQEKILRQYDEILVIGQHQLIEKGSFDELYEKKGYFYSLYTIAT